MTALALPSQGPVLNNRVAARHAHRRVAARAGNPGVSPVERKPRLLVVIELELGPGERGWVAAVAEDIAVVPKLAQVRVLVARRATRRRPAILDGPRGPGRNDRLAVTPVTGRLRVRARQRVPRCGGVVEGTNHEGRTGRGVAAITIASPGVQGELPRMRVVVAGLALCRGADESTSLQLLVRLVTATAGHRRVGAF